MKKQQEAKVQPTTNRKPVEKPAPRKLNPPKVQSELDRLMDMYAQL